MLLDSNLVIYAATPEHETVREFVARYAPSVSVVTQVETLGYHAITEAEVRFLTEFFACAPMLPITPPIIAEAIRLRQQRRMSLGDAFIGATASVHGLALATHNVKDFAWIDGLSVIDPLA